MKRKILFIDTNALLSLAAKSRPEELEKNEEFSAFDKERQKNKVKPHELRAALASQLIKENSEIHIIPEIREEFTRNIERFYSKGMLSPNNKETLFQLDILLQNILVSNQEKPLTPIELIVHNSKIKTIEALTSKTQNDQTKKFKEKSNEIFQYPEHNTRLLYKSPIQKAEENLEEEKLLEALRNEERNSLKNYRLFKKRTEPKIWTDLAILMKAKKLTETKEAEITIITGDKDLHIIQHYGFKQPIAKIEYPSDGGNPPTPKQIIGQIREKIKTSKPQRDSTQIS
jgi:hypothetical protein